MSNDFTFDWGEEDGEALSELVSGEPVRDIRTRRNARSITGHLNSVHSDARYVFESLGEMRHALVCDADWDVTRLVVQPCTLMLADGRRYTPDALVYMRSGARPVFREIKPEKWLRAEPELKGKLQLIAHACNERGCDFEIISNAWYDTQPRLRNAMWMRRAARHAPAEHANHVAAILRDHGSRTFKQIRSESGLDMAGVFAAFALAGRRFCRVDIDQPFSDDTLFDMSFA